MQHPTGTQLSSAFRVISTHQPHCANNLLNSHIIKTRELTIPVVGRDFARKYQLNCKTVQDANVLPQGFQRGDLTKKLHVFKISQCELIYVSKSFPNKVSTHVRAVDDAIETYHEALFGM